MPKQTFYEGQTATNPTTGERIVYSKGRWGPVGAASKPALVKDTKTDLDYINKAKDEGNGLLDSATQMERFIDLNRKMPTGPGMGAKLPFMPTAGDALVKPFSPTYQAMQAITAHLTPRERPSGSGPTSNFDAVMYGQAVPGVDKFGTVNQSIYEAKKQDAVRAKARGTFLDRYYAKAGTMTGADAAFDKFWTQYQSQGSGGGHAPGVFQGKFGTVRPVGE